MPAFPHYISPMRFRLSLTLALLFLATRLDGQVGHPPASSPYRDILYGMSITPYVGWIGGDGGDIGIGPHDGVVYGGRIDYRLSGTVSLGASFETGVLDRLIVDADDPVNDRVTGPVSQRLSMFEGTVQLNITGKKSWHGLAPFVGGTAGVAWAEETPADTSGYRFGTRAVLAPLFGFRLLLGQRVQMRVDGRWLFWQLKYPSSYFDEPADDPAPPGGRSHAVLAGHHAEEWTGGAEFRFGLGINF
jgi:hypothetical protein